MKGVAHITGGRGSYCYGRGRIPNEVWSCINSIENSMSSGDIDKTLLAFLNGLSRRQYFGEDQFSDQFLREEVLGNISVDGEVIYTLIIVNFVWVYVPFLTEYMGLLKRFQTIIGTMASADMDFAQLDAFLTSQMKKRQVFSNLHNTVLIVSIFE